MSLNWNDWPTANRNDYTPASTRGEKCSMCSEPAKRKVEEVIFDDDPQILRHNLTAYVCLACFNKIMGRK